MTTEKQIQANRENAKTSTGPTTQRGKAHSRFNSRKHGLTAKTLITVGECADDFEALRAELVEEYDPQSHLVDPLIAAANLWRESRRRSPDSAQAADKEPIPSLPQVSSTKSSMP